jgi:hypothetical protein
MRMIARAREFDAAGRLGVPLATIEQRIRTVLHLIPA